MSANKALLLKQLKNLNYHILVIEQDTELKI